MKEGKGGEVVFVTLFICDQSDHHSPWGWLGGVAWQSWLVWLSWAVLGWAVLTIAGSSSFSGIAVQQLEATGRSQ